MPAGHLLLTRAASVGAVQRMTCAYLAHSDSLVTDTELRHLGCLAAFLFAVMGADHEEEAFYTLLALVEDRLPASCILQVRSSVCLAAADVLCLMQQSGGPSWQGVTPGIKACLHLPAS